MPPDRTTNENDIIAIEVFYFAGKQWPNVVVSFFFGFIGTFSEFIGIRGCPLNTKQSSSGLFGNCFCNTSGITTPTEICDKNGSACITRNRIGFI